MKKIFSILIVLISLTNIFAEDFNFYKNNPTIDLMYVDSPEGLRIRNQPSLNSEKIGVLYDRMIVKVIEIGELTTIDGIKSNWIKILIPIDTIKNNEKTYGWVFGGYLSKSLKQFTTVNWTDLDLKRYISRFAWVQDNHHYYENFSSDGKYTLKGIERGIFSEGTYDVSLKNKTITIETLMYTDDTDGPWEKTIVYKIVSISENNLVYDFNGKKITLIPAFTNWFFRSCFNHEKIEMDEQQQNSINALFYLFSSKILMDIKSDEVFWKNMIKMGIKIPENINYMKSYNQYWDK